MRKSIIEISEDTLKKFKDSNSYKESFNYDAQTMSELCDYFFGTTLSLVGIKLESENKMNLLIRFIVNNSETLLISDLSIFNEKLHEYKYGSIGELIWGLEVDNEQPSPIRIEAIVGWNDLNIVEFSPNFKLKGSAYESVSTVEIDGILYSVEHAKGELYNFGVIDHTNKRVVLPFIFNHIAIGIQTRPFIVSANYQGRWYVLKPNGENFDIENIEKDTIVDSHRYTLIDGFDHGLARVRIDDLWGIINTDGDEVLPIEYQSIWNFYKKNRVSTKVLKEGKISDVWFKDLAKKDSLLAIDGSPLERLPYMPKLKSIGMKNFKRFKDETEIQFKDINFCVGPNNAGKSTSIKALILMSCNLKQLHFNFVTKVNNGSTDRSVFMPFNFAPQEYPNLNTNSFDLSVNRYGKWQSILLTMSYGQCDFSAQINKESNIEILTIFSHNTNLKIIVYNNLVRLCSNNILLSEYQIRDNKDIYPSLRGTELLNAIVDGFIKMAPLSDESIKDNLEILKFDIQSSILNLGNETIIHIPIYSASRLAILNRYDNNDLSAKAAMTYFDLSDVKKNFVKGFMRKWMNSEHFNIGTDFKIEAIKGRNTLLTIEVKGVDGTWVDLCDMGTGSNHLFILLLSVACLIGEYATTTVRPIIVIEEPEMNLHPKFQSMLTDMFADANKCIQDLSKKFFSQIYMMSDQQTSNWGFQFIIETHSEYMIRKSQILVAEFVRDNQLYENGALEGTLPVQIYYFPYETKDSPYLMKFRSNGTFETTFGDGGFFDEAGKSHFKLVKIAKDLGHV